MRSHLLTAAISLAVSLLVSVLAVLYFDTFVFLLFVPFVPFLLRNWGGTDRPTRWECPRCGFRTTDTAYDYCPRDGERLQERR